jgi:hypothetical protein
VLKLTAAWRLVVLCDDRSDNRSRAEEYSQVAPCSWRLRRGCQRGFAGGWFAAAQHDDRGSRSAIAIGMAARAAVGGTEAMKRQTGFVVHLDLGGAEPAQEAFEAVG